MNENSNPRKERNADAIAVTENPKGDHVATSEGRVSNDLYDPFDARPAGQQNTDFAVFMHLLKASVGSGILFLPYAFKRTGYISAIVCSAIIGLISCHTAVIVVQCAQILCKRTRRPMLNFAETAEASFQVGPEWIRKYARSFNVTANVFVCFVQYQTTVIYAIYVATSSKQIIEHLTGISIDLRIYIVTFFPAYCGLALVPDFKRLVPFSIAGAAFLGFGFFATFYYFFRDFPNPGRLVGHTNFSALPRFAGIFLFAVQNMSVIMPLENTMKNPRHMPIILASSMILNIFTYIAFGFFGYNRYIDACDTVIKNLPLDDVLAQTIKVAITLSVILTYGVQYAVPVTILWPMMASKMREDHHYEIFFRLGGVVASTLLAVAVPQMAPLLGLFASVSITTIVLLIPVLIDITTKWHNPDHRLTFYCRTFKNAIVFAIWLYILIFGTSSSLIEIVRSYGDTSAIEPEVC